MGLSNDLSCEAGSLSCCRSIPTGSFSQKSEALFPRAGALGYAVCFAPHRLSRFICVRVWGRGVPPAALPAPVSSTLSPALSVYLCANVAPKGLLVVRLPALFVPHSASLGPPGPRMSSPTRCQSPPLLSVWMYVSFFIYFVLDFLAV